MFTAPPDLIIQPKPDYWALRASAVWASDYLDITIPQGFITDLASIPQALRNVLDVDGKSRCPAILHDWLYTLQKFPRSFADECLRKALMEYGEGYSAAWIYYAGVRLGGWKPWDERVQRGGGPQTDDFMSMADYMAWLTRSRS